MSHYDYLTEHLIEPVGQEKEDESDGVEDGNT